jgi:hypothetical protein
VTTYSSIEHNAKTYGKAKFLKKVQDTLVKLNEPQRMQANANAKIAKKLNLSPPRVVKKVGRVSYHVNQHWDTSSFVELQQLTSLEALIDNSIDSLKPAHMSNLMAMLELRNKEGGELVKRGDDAVEADDDKFGTLRIELKHCKVNRDLDNNVIDKGTNDIFIAAKVGGDSPRSMRKITLTHDNTEEISFKEGDVDSMLEFKNVEYEALKHFKLFALDDDVLGYDTIGKTKRQSLDSTSDFVTKKLYYNKDKKVAGTITYKVDWIPGAVAAKGTEGKEYQAPWKRWTKFPNYNKNSDYGSKIGTSGERNKARILGFVIGLFAGASAGMLDLLDQIGEGFFENVENNWGPVGEQWEKMQGHMAKAVKSPSFKNLKAALKELLKVGKVLLQFLWKIVTTKEFAMIGLIIGMVAVFIAVVSMLPTNFALMFTVINAIFSAWYISDQFVDIYHNLHKCDGGKCLLHHVYKGWGAVGRLIGYCLAEFLYMKSFQDLWKQGKLMLGKMNKNGASKINIEKLTKATKVKAEPKALPKPAPKAKAPKAKAPKAPAAKPVVKPKAPAAKPVVKPKKAAPKPMRDTYYAARDAKAPKVESGEEIKKRLAVTMKKYKGKGKEDMLTANPMGTSYYASRNAKAAKVETGEEIKKRLAVTMKKYKKPVVADDAAKVADDVVKQADDVVKTADDVVKNADDVVKNADDVAAAAKPKKDVYEEAAKAEKKKKAAEKSEQTNKRVEQKRKEVMSKGTDYWGATKKRTRL